MTIGSLGYLGFKVSDLSAWHGFAVDVLGMMPAEPADGAQRYRLDGQAWRVAVEPGETDDIAYVGFEVAGPEALEAVGERLAAGGFAAAAGDEALKTTRGVTDLLTCQDPDGLAVEIYYGPTLRQETPFASPAGVGGFLTGSQGLGHVVLSAPDIARTRAFYRDALGFRLSDIIRMRLSPTFAMDLEFYHCNPRHHTLAFAPVPARKRLNHFMVQVNSLDDVGFALERMARAGATVTQTLGRHSNDHMVSFYARTPSGFEVEYGWGALEVDDAIWQVTRHDVTSLWGHKRTGA